MNFYNGYSGREREAKLRALNRVKAAGEFPSPPDGCMLCGDPDVVLAPHSEDYSEPFLWTAPAMFWLCKHCHLHKLHKRFNRPDAWRTFLRHVRRGGYARELTVPEYSRDLRDATNSVGDENPLPLRLIRSRDLVGEQWWERLTLDPASRESPEFRPRP